MGLEAAELARWTRFAGKGGIGKCIATCDCVAESADDLMFLKDDEITVLLQLPDREGFYLGYCEGVVGRFSGQDVRFTSKLKKPVMTKRSSSMGTVSSTAKSPSPTVLTNATSPSPTPHTSISYHPQHGVTHRTSSTPSPSTFRSVSVSSLSSRTRAESLERAGDRRGSGGMGMGPRHQASPLSASRSLGSPDNDQEQSREGSPALNAFATLHEVAVAEAAASGIGGQTRYGSIGSRKEYQYTATPLGTPSPREVQFARADSSSERRGSRTSTRANSPRQEDDDRLPGFTERSPTQGSSSSQPLSTSTSTSSASFTFTTASSSSSPQTSPSSSPPRPLYTQPHSIQQHRYTAHAPSPLTLNPDQYSGSSGGSNFTPPLRITKRSPVPGSNLGFAVNSNPIQQISPPPTSALPLVPGSPPANAGAYSANASISTSQTLSAPIYPQGLSPSTSAFSPLSSPSVYSSPPHSAVPTLPSSSSSPSHTATFAHRLGLNSAQGSPASQVPEAEFTGGTVGSSPAILSHEDQDRSVDEQGLNRTASQRQAAAGVSIGLSLLEGLIGSYSDDESDEDDEPRSQYSDQGNNTMTRNIRDNRISTVSRDSVNESEEGTVEGLGYARSEESHTMHRPRQATYASLAQHDQVENAPREPLPPTTQNHDPQLLSPATSPTSPSFPIRPSQSASRERRPSLAPSASSVQSGRSGASASTATSARTTSWEGAGDIYDDYRYSRASMRPPDAMSIRSVGGAGERRPSFDSVGSSGGYFMGMSMRRERVDSGASSFGGTRLGGLAEDVERDEHTGYNLVHERDADQGINDDTTGSDSAKDIPPSLADVHTQRLSQAHQRTSSVDSDASVYTQNSRLSTLSRDLALGGVLASLAAPDQSQDKDQAEGGHQESSSHAQLRPPPITLPSPNEPLLHTTWGSAVSSPGMSPFGIAAYTPVAGVMEVEGHGSYNPGSVPSQNLSGNGLQEDEDGALKSPTTTAGFASAMRMRLEEDRLARAAKIHHDGENATRSSLYQEGGLGSRIVIEDEDELPSRVVDDTYDSQANTTDSIYQDGDSKDGFASVESHDTDSTAHNLGARANSRITSSPSPEPEIFGGLGLGGNLAPLVVVNNAPSPSLFDSASDDGRVNLAAGGAKASTTPSPDPPTTLAASPAPSSSPSPAPSPSPSHLRPSLADLREPTGAPLPGTNQRRSLFLPHPNAPKSPAGLVSPGPMYIAAQQQAPPGWPNMRQGPPGPGGPMQPMPYGPQFGAPRPGVLQVIRMALSRPPPPMGVARAPNQIRGPTIYGRTEADLGAAVGPVPIMFSIEPPPPGTVTGPALAPVGQGKGPQIGAPPTSPPRVQMMVKGGAPKSQIGQESQSIMRTISMGSGATVPSNSGNTSNSSLLPSNSSPPINEPGKPASNTPSSTLAVPGANSSAGPIPRANFFPKAGGLRPRSRSFSGFNSTSSSVPVPLQRSREDAEISAKDVHHSLTARASSGSLFSTTQNKPGTIPLRPSPLSLSHLGGGGLKPSPTSPLLKSPSSPLAQSTFVPTSEPAPPSQSPEISLSTPSTTTKLGGSGGSSSDAANIKPTAQLREIPSRSTLNESLLRSPPNPRSNSLISSGRTPSLQGNPGITSSLLSSNSARPSSPHSMMDLGAGEPRAQMSSPPVVTRQNSLRSKLSLPNLRRKQSRQDDDSSTNASSGAVGSSGLSTIASPTSPIGTGLSLLHDPEMLQVKDMEFELVRPNLAHHFTQAARTSEDSNVLGRDGSLDLRQESSSFLRAESPAFSISSGGGGSTLLSGQRSPTTEGGWSQTVMATSVSPPPGGSRAPTDSESSMDAHRQRELKWMSLMSANPASSARKSKKVRKLVVEGVPSSVRYLVWSYLTDGKARCVPGVYSQLCARGKVGVVGRIEEDIKRGFGDVDAEQEQLYSHLRGTQGPVGTLLSAYLNMVPDVQYSMGLTLIVGQLLILAPEEDAFWTFVSVMDTHIRPYFSSTTTQMEVDAALFSRALENNDQQLAKKVFVDMGILPTAICQPWFSTLFVGTLPPEYLNRVWDLFLFEGVPFLIRVGLALMQCCRRRILESTSDEAVFHVLRHPPPSFLPPTPDAFLGLAFNVKHKDDDMRKQRVKMEAQIKRQTQVPRTASTSGMISYPRT
ncbi:hypothetical protein BDN70DRAFT_659976 [Pholiota conissans]|uniref:Rab-GAP TBC domain-containing protein n=1 Tax=Pholiota conissans TaxID=109636 RepID=A0A9P5YIY0_9AGAR|nr:hypothetical protein BDN70DRAFT_659976 [Pholiota conissans]